ncbi:MAG TPA: alpha/beta fold hydrolase [Candidatus Moranbacteria bacterium]|nr:alpha/beta fold hydrolase [Candidatus Moranbacteria bacterium]
MKKELLLIFLALSIGAFSLFWQKYSTEKESLPGPAVSSTPLISPEKTAPAPHPHSLPSLMAKEFGGGGLELGQVLERNEAYTRYAVTYLSEGLKISGIMNIPHGEGPFPVLLLNHGYIDPAIYRSGQGLRREQDYFARRGYVVLHSDYRNHAFSDIDPENDTKPRTGYTEDVINAAMAVKRSDLKMLDGEKIGMLGHSMGGGVSINVMVTKPELVKAVVLYAPINADYRKNFDRWVAPEMPDIAERTLAQYGTFEENPDFWRSVSAVNYLDRVNAPVMIHQGTADQDVPVEWSRELSEKLQQAGKEVTYYEYAGGPHEFIKEWPLFMSRSAGLFDRVLK